MVGNNTLVVCRAEMIDIVQYYLDNVLLKEPVQVHEVIEDRSEGVFHIAIREVSKETSGGKNG